MTGSDCYFYEATEYKILGNEGVRESWMPAKNMRKQCSTAPILFNINHKAAVMRQSEEGREETVAQVGVTWVPEGSFDGGVDVEKR